MGAVSLPDDQKSLVILVDNEHRCQLLYRSPPPARLLSLAPLSRAAPKTRKATGHPTRGLRKASPRACPARGIRRRATSRMLRAGPAVPKSALPEKAAASSRARGNYTGSPGAGQASERRPRSDRSEAVPSTSPSTATRWSSIACRAALGLRFGVGVGCARGDW